MSALTIPQTFVNGTTIQAAPFNQNFAAIVTWSTAIDNTNIGPAGLFANQIIPLTSAQGTFGGLLPYNFPTILSVGPSASTIPVAGDINLSRSANTGFAYFGSSNTNNGFVGFLGAHSALIGSSDAVATSLTLNGTFYAANGTTFSAPSSVGAGDTVAQRSASTGASFWGGATDFCAADYSLNSPGALTIIVKTGGGVPLRCGPITNISDIALKENVVPITGALATIERLKPSSFDMKDTGKPTFGFIAQDVQAVLPQIVDDVGKYKGIDYAAITPWNTAAIVEMAAMLKAAGVAGF